MDSAGQIVVVTIGGAEVSSWLLAGAGPLDLSVVDDLARLGLAARRLGYAIRLRRPCPELLELLDLAGLRLEAVGEAEGGEQLRVEEVVMPDDPVA